jgi:hypothetical protein
MRVSGSRATGFRPKQLRPLRAGGTVVSSTSPSQRNLSQSAMSAGSTNAFLLPSLLSRAQIHLADQHGNSAMSTREPSEPTVTFVVTGAVS